MLKEKSLVIYKNRPALLVEVNDKLTIRLEDGKSLKVREKDIEFLHPGPLSSLGELKGTEIRADVEGAWELLEGSVVPLSELAELAYGSWSPQSAWAAYGLLKEGLFFEGTLDALKPKNAEEVERERQKRKEREQAASEREAFLERLKSGKLHRPDDDQRLQDVEALAMGHTEKSRTMKDLGKPETPQEAHRILLSLGYWEPRVNPYPSRFGISLSAPLPPISAPPKEKRVDLTSIPAYAIDNQWSDDPDDALSLESNVLYIHIADPASSVHPGSPADLEARGRGATLYLPEARIRMLDDQALTHFALGLSDPSPALSIKLNLTEDGSIEDIEILRSFVKVTRMDYGQADSLADSKELAPLFALAEKNIARRSAAKAVFIELPEVHISVLDGVPTITPIQNHASAVMVRECMLLAGEAVARWATRNMVPFPYIVQETGDLPSTLLPGFAGSYQLRRCMRPRSVSIKPGTHGGLGLDFYTQVTSPLRRYMDLIAHQQIRGILTGAEVISTEELLPRIAAGEAAALTTVQAERTSRAHWTMVYLSTRMGTRFSGVVVEQKGHRATVLIPELAMETQVSTKNNVELNEPVNLELSKVRIPDQQALFILE